MAGAEFNPQPCIQLTRLKDGWRRHSVPERLGLSDAIAVFRLILLPGKCTLLLLHQGN